jgi:hypothetical protein
MFFVGVYHDQVKAKACITALRQIYRSEPVISISDGVDDADYEKFCRNSGVEYHFGNRLKLQKFGGLWIERYFRHFLKTRESRLIKVDPDTAVNRATSLLDAPVFSAFRGDRILAGPAIGFSRDTVQKVVDSALLHDPKYTASKYAYHRFIPPLLKPGEEQSFDAIALQDEIITDVVARLGIEPIEWSAVSFTDAHAPFYHPR